MAFFEANCVAVTRLFLFVFTFNRESLLGSLAYSSIEPSHVLITTDGQENAGHRFSSDEVKKMIEHQKAERGWEFLFIGANVDAVETAACFGIGRNRAVNYTADSEGTQLLYETLSAPICAMRADQEISDDWGKCIEEDHNKRK